MLPFKLQRLLRPKRYVLCALFVSIGGFIFGFDTGSIGPITLMPHFTASMGPRSEGSVMQGLIVSLILLPAAAMSLFSGSIADKISRTYTIGLGASLYALGTLLCCLASIGVSQEGGLAMLMTGRILAGFGEGAFLAQITVYSVEIAPTRVRGSVGGIVQMYIVTGIMTGFFVTYGTLNIDGTASWRIPFALQAFLCTVLSIGCFFLPHSPRWLLHIGRREEAEDSFQRLGMGEAEKKEILRRDEAREEEERASAGQRGWRKTWDGIKTLWKPQFRRKTAMALYMQGTQQLSGIDGVLFYAPVLFTQAGLDSGKASFLASGITGVVNVVVTIIAQCFTDRMGRRPALIWSAVIMAIAMTIIGSVYASHASDVQSGQYAIIAFIFVFFIVFDMTWAILVRLHVSEAQPVETRAMLSSLSLAANWLTNFVVALTTPVFLEKSACGPYFLWGGSLWVAAAVFFVFLQETKGVDLEDANEPLRSQVDFKALQKKFFGSKDNAVTVQLQEVLEESSEKSPQGDA